MNKHMLQANASPPEFRKALRRALPPEGMAAGIGACLGPRAVRAAAMDVSGAPIGAASLVLLGKRGKPVSVMLADGIPRDGDAMRVWFGGKEYLLTLEKKDGRLDGKAQSIGGTWFVELRVESAKLIIGEEKAKPDRDSWDDVMAEAELVQLAEELGELVMEMLAAEVLGAQFKFADGSRLTGKELFVDVKAERRTVRRDCGGKEFSAISINAGEKGAVKALLVEGCGMEGLRDLKAKFINLEGYEMFTVEVAGRRYAGLIY